MSDVTAGFAIRVANLDAIEHHVAEQLARMATFDVLAAYREWRQSTGLPPFPTGDDEAGVAPVAAQEVIEGIDVMVMTAAFSMPRTGLPPADVFRALLVVAAELDCRIDGFRGEHQVRGTGIVVRSRVGLLALTSGGVIRA